MAAMRKLSDGTYEEVNGTPFNYTGKTVLGLKSYNKELDKEMSRVIGMKGIWEEVMLTGIQKIGKRKYVK